MSFQNVRLPLHKKFTKSKMLIFPQGDIAIFSHCSKDQGLLSISERFKKHF